MSNRNLQRARWLEDLLLIEGFGYPGVKFAGIYLTDRLDQKDVFGVFAQYRDHKREHERYPFADGIYISREMTEGNPLHLICTAAHEIAHWKLMKDGLEYRNSEAYAETYTILFLYEFFSPRLSKKICEVHRYGEDPCRLEGVRERATVLINGTERQKIVGNLILKYLGSKRPSKFLGKSVGLDARIANLESRLAGG